MNSRKLTKKELLNLGKILCKSKPKLLPNSNSRVYHLDFTCNKKLKKKLWYQRKVLQHAAQSISNTELRQTGISEELQNGQKIIAMDNSPGKIQHKNGFLEVKPKCLKAV